jgi:hypothetical protein
LFGHVVAKSAICELNVRRWLARAERRTRSLGQIGRAGDIGEAPGTIRTPPKVLLNRFDNRAIAVESEPQLPVGGAAAATAKIHELPPFRPFVDSYDFRKARSARDRIVPTEFGLTPIALATSAYDMPDERNTSAARCRSGSRARWSRTISASSRRVT